MESLEHDDRFVSTLTEDHGLLRIELPPDADIEVPESQQNLKVTVCYSEGTAS